MTPERGAARPSPDAASPRTEAGRRLVADTFPVQRDGEYERAPAFVFTQQALFAERVAAIEDEAAAMERPEADREQYTNTEATDALEVDWWAPERQRPASPASPHTEAGKRLDDHVHTNACVTWEHPRAACDCKSIVRRLATAIEEEASRLAAPRPSPDAVTLLAEALSASGILPMSRLNDRSAPAGARAMLAASPALRAALDGGSVPLLEASWATALGRVADLTARLRESEAREAALQEALRDALEFAYEVEWEDDGEDADKRTAPWRALLAGAAPAAPEEDDWPDDIDAVLYPDAGAVTPSEEAR